MAKFQGTAREFKRYFGPFARNNVQYFTRKYKAEVGACEHCGALKRLEAAHIHGRERNTLIGKVLGVDHDGAIVDVDLALFEAAFLAEHQPFNRTFLILCFACHRRYDALISIDSQNETAQSVSSTLLRKHGVLPITFEPAAEAEFKKCLLQTRWAQIAVYYVSGRVEHKTWNANKFKGSSNLIGNLRSRPEFRKGAWEDAGIERVHVSIVQFGR